MKLAMTINELNQFYVLKLQPESERQYDFVLGEGNTQSPLLMLIGEAPGEQEVRQKRPFVGKAGKNLDEFLTFMQIHREDIYITNTVKFRPTKVSARGRESNRAPTRKERALFIPWLMREIDAVRPRIIVTLGNTPLQAVLGDHAVIGDFHGRLVTNSQGKMVFPLYHPAAVIYNRSLLDVYHHDLSALKTVVSK